MYRFLRQVSPTVIFFRVKGDERREMKPEMVNPGSAGSTRCFHAEPTVLGLQV